MFGSSHENYLTMFSPIRFEEPTVKESTSRWVTTLLLLCCILVWLAAYYGPARMKPVVSNEADDSHTPSLPTTLAVRFDEAMQASTPRKGLVSLRRLQPIQRRKEVQPPTPAALAILRVPMSPPAAREQQPLAPAPPQAREISTPAPVLRQLAKAPVSMPLDPKAERDLEGQDTREGLGQSRNGTGEKRHNRTRRVDRTGVAARPGIEKGRRAAGKQTRGGAGASPGEKRSQGGKPGKAEQPPKTPGEVATVPKPKLKKRKASVGTSQEERTPKRSRMAVEEDESATNAGA